jgi:putative transposase
MLDYQVPPAAEILRAYLRRWRLEMGLDDLKTTLKMQTLRHRSPKAVHKELYRRRIAHNLVRALMAQAANQQGVSLDRIRFKGSRDTSRQFRQAMAQARTKKKRTQPRAELLAALAADRLPLRPDRREPRAVKRKKNKYPRLHAPRHLFRDPPKRHARRKLSRLRKLGLM